MRIPTSDPVTPRQRDRQTELPAPTPGYRRRAWLTFQRALDPLARPRPLRPPNS